MVISKSSYKNIVILTGAGISASSGLRTYRGPDGLWNDPETRRLSTIDGFAEDPQSYWNFWGSLREKACSVQPNKAHLALADWEKSLAPDQKFTLITQNIDELHQRAGSVNVVELHGSIFRTRCSNEKCELVPFRDVETHSSGVPKCTICSATLRPDVILFGEMLPVEAEWNAKRSLRDCDLFIAIGTSGTVSPASRFVEWAKYAQAKTVLVNLEPMSPRNQAFDREVTGKAESVLPQLLK